MSIYLLTDERPVSELLELLEPLLKVGLKWIQLRNKRANANEIYETALALIPLIERYKAHLIVNDHLDVAYDLQLGVHLGMDDGDPVYARRLLGKEAIVGITIHNHIERAYQYADVATYVGVGPIFHTNTKKDAKPVIHLNGLEEVVRMSPLPVVAIGGIDRHNIQSVARVAPRHIALCSAICAAAEPIKEWHHLCTLVGKK